VFLHITSLRFALVQAIVSDTSGLQFSVYEAVSKSFRTESVTK